MNGTPSDIELIFEQVNLPLDVNQTVAQVVVIQGMDILLSLLTIITIATIFILRYEMKRVRK
jgi:hypothetical protein